MGKETVLVRESPGFITTRVNASIGNEAFYMLMEGVASARDIDKALKLGLNHPMGPFELVDLVGLDTRLSILEYLHRSHGREVPAVPAARAVRESGPAWARRSAGECMSTDRAIGYWVIGLLAARGSASSVRPADRRDWLEHLNSPMTQ